MNWRGNYGILETNYQRGVHWETPPFYKIILKF